MGECLKLIGRVKREFQTKSRQIKKLPVIRIIPPINSQPLPRHCGGDVSIIIILQFDI